MEDVNDGKYWETFDLVLQKWELLRFVAVLAFW